MDGSSLINLTQSSWIDTNPNWSPDGRKIVFASGRDGNGEIYIMNADGSNQQNITNHSGDDEQPAWLAGSRPTPIKDTPWGALKRVIRILK